MQNQTRNLVIVAILAALVVVTCWKQSPGQGEKAAPAWEHKSMLYPGDNAMDKLALDRWEICGAYAKPAGTGAAATVFSIEVILRRPKAAK